MIGHWLAFLSELGVTNDNIIHRAGADHINADCLSRIPVRRCPRSDCGEHNSVATPGVVSANSDCAVVDQDDLRSWALVTLLDAQQADCGIKTLRFDCCGCNQTGSSRS